MSAENANRQEYEREWTDLRNRRDVELRNLAAGYRAKAAVTDPQEKKHLRAEQRKAEASIVKAYQPEDYGVLLHRKADRDEATLDRLEALYKQRGPAAVPARELLHRKAPPPRAIDPQDA